MNNPQTQKGFARIVAFIVIVVALVAGSIYLYTVNTKSISTDSTIETPAPSTDSETNTGANSNNGSTKGDSTVLPAKPQEIVTLKLNEVYKRGDASFLAWAVTEDSRCPADVQCIQAGKVVVAVRISDTTGTSIAEMVPGQKKALKPFTITLNSVGPNKLSTHKIADDEYKFTFTIVNN